MPPLPDVPGVIRFDLHFTLSEDLHAKCRFFEAYSGTPPTDTQLNTAAASVRVNFGTDLKALMSIDYSLTEVILTDLTSSTSGIGSDSTAVAGTDSNPPLTADVCLLQSQHVARRYRGGHPRIYWPFGTQVHLSDPQTWLDAFVTSCTTDLNTFFGALPAITWSGGAFTHAVNVSYYEGFTVHTGVTGRARNVSTPRVTPVVDQINSLTVRKGVATQRNRLLHLA